MALTFTPTYELTENGDDCYVIYGGQAYHIYVDLLQNDPVVIESIDTIPADTTGKMAYPTAKEELKSLIDASTPVFYEKSTETTPVSTTTATTSTTKVTTTNTTSVSTSATGSSSKEKETTVSSTTTTTTTTVTTPTTIAAETTVESTVPTETETTEAKTRKLGDVHYDDHIDIMDVIKMNKFILGTATIRKDELVYADIDKDGSVSATDSLWLLKRIVEMISEEDFNDIPGYLKKTNS